MRTNELNSIYRQDKIKKCHELSHWENTGESHWTEQLVLLHIRSRSGSPRHSRGVLTGSCSTHVNQTSVPVMHVEIVLWARKEQKITGFMPKAATLTA